MGFPEGLKVIDGSVVANLGETGGASHVRGGAEDEYLFRGITEKTKTGETIEEMVAKMDAAGIEKGVLEVPMTHTEDYDQDPTMKAVKQYPDRFVGYCSDYSASPNDGMAGVRRLERLVKDYDVKALHIRPSRVGYPPNDKRYYPLYAKCIELDIPVTLNTGIPLPRDLAWFQDPIHLDEVCWFFPELKVVMTHGGEPWQAMCVKLLLKWPNLYYMNVGSAPKYYPQEIIYYMNTRGADKVLYAAGYPLIEFQRGMTEVKELPLRDHVWSKFLRENAIKVFKL